ELPAPEEVLAPARGDLEGMGSRIRIGMGGGAVERLDKGEWMVALRLPQGEYGVALERQMTGGGVCWYLLSEQGLYRSCNEGEKWEQARGPVFRPRTLADRFTALAVAEGEFFLGDAAGGITQVELGNIEWHLVSQE
ncbi:MAG: hypothetical protein H5T69_13960, partial [Chloroflexi bacterium]|nr:hypothetical protein [Chloroflexota bacterium]